MTTRKTPSARAPRTQRKPNKAAAKAAPKDKARARTKKKVSKKAPGSKLDQAKAQMYRDLIFSAAEVVFGQNGFEGTTMQEIATEAGVSVKTLYGAFPGKRELYHAIMYERGEQMFAAVEAAHNSEIEPIEKLAAGIRAFVEFFFDHEHWTRIHMQSHLSWAMKPETPETAALWEKGQAQHCKVLREGIEAGVFFDDDPDETAQLMRAMTRVITIRAIQLGGETAESVTQRLAPRVLRMVCLNPKDAAAAN